MRNINFTLLKSIERWFAHASHQATPSEIKKVCDEQEELLKVVHEGAWGARIGKTKLTRTT